MKIRCVRPGMHTYYVNPKHLKTGLKGAEIVLNKLGLRCISLP